MDSATSFRCPPWSPTAVSISSWASSMPTVDKDDSLSAGDNILPRSGLTPNGRGDACRIVRCGLGACKTCALPLSPLDAQFLPFAIQLDPGRDLDLGTLAHLQHEVLDLVVLHQIQRQIVV